MPTANSASCPTRLMNSGSAAPCATKSRGAKPSLRKFFTISAASCGRPNAIQASAPAALARATCRAKSVLPAAWNSTAVAASP
ncbi:hypothetical protein D3C83_49340 [compost metagenome]